MLVKAAFPITTGFEDTFDTYINAGKVRNIGWELTANSVNLTGELGWETNLTVTYNKNKIKDLNSDTPAVAQPVRRCLRHHAGRRLPP